MPKDRIKKFKEMSQRHLYNLKKKEQEQFQYVLNNDLSTFEGPSTSQSNCVSSHDAKNEFPVPTVDIEFPNNNISDSSNDRYKISSSEDEGNELCHSNLNQFTDDDDETNLIGMLTETQSTTLASLNNCSFLNTTSSHSNDAESPTCSSEYVEKLANWATKFNIKGNALNALLDIQRNEPGYSSLPKDKRTLLQTPRTTKIRNVAPGQYYHFGLNIALSLFIQSLNGEIPNYISLKVGIDGLPISKSSSSQIWPILCMFKSDKIKSYNSQVYPIGAYHGNEKPFCSNDLLKDFIEEIIPLLNNGFHDDSTNATIQIHLFAVICDAPAKSFVFKTKGHSGFYSCTRCTQKGESSNRRVYFPDLDASLRTHCSFMNQHQKEYHVGTTDLIHLPKFDLVKCVPLDYMHLICLGVVKKLLFMWLFFKKGPRRLPNHIIESISEQLTQLKDHTPDEFARKPRTLLEANRWKATELRQFLLYTGPIVLKNKVNHSVYLNFLALSVAISILLSQTYHKIYLNYADALLKWFVTNFANVYGKMYISHNVHALIHLKSDVEQFGPLDDCSAFPFENYMFSIKQLLTRKPDKPLQQFARRYAEKISTEIKCSETLLKSNSVVKNSHIDGPILDNNIFLLQYKDLTLPNFNLSVSSGNNCCKLSDSSIIVVYNIVKDSNSLNIIGKTFMKVTDFYLEPCPSSKVGVYFVEKLGCLQSWSVKEIAMKCLMYPYQNGFVIYPFLHT